MADHRNDGGDADNDAERRQNGAHGVAPQGAQGDLDGVKTRMARRLSDFCPASLLLAKPPNPTRGNGQNLGDLYANWSQIGSSDYIPCSIKGAVCF